MLKVRKKSHYCFCLLTCLVTEIDTDFGVMLIFERQSYLKILALYHVPISDIYAFKTERTAFVNTGKCI